MTLQEVVKAIGAAVVTGEERLEEKVTGVYVSDLLSDVMGHARAGEVWLTIQTHTNVVAVALLLHLAAVVFTSGAKPGTLTVERAEKEGVVLLTTDLSTFETAGRLFQKQKESAT
ncbi:MAG TPA: DRTGG domain-containing protein [Capillibacterium sp.]